MADFFHGQSARVPCGTISKGSEDCLKIVGDDRIAFDPFLRDTNRMQHGGVVASVEAAADARQAFATQLPSQVHGDATCQGNGSPS